jgi:hypothetical protein
MKNFLLIGLIIFSFLTFNLKVETQECEDLKLTSTSDMVIYENKVYCNLIVTDEAKLKIFNNVTIKVLNNFTIKRSAQVNVENSKLEIFSPMYILDRSSLFIRDSFINVSSSIMRIEGESKLSLNGTKLYAEELIINIKGTSSLNVTNSEFIGNIIIYPYSYSKLFINKTYYFNVYLSNQQFDITIYRSKFSLKIEVASKPSNPIILPYGYYNYWNLSYITKEYIGVPGKIRVYDSSIGIFNSNEIIVLTDSLTVSNSKNITLTLRDKFKINNLRGGNLEQSMFQIENTRVNVIQSSIYAWNIECYSGKHYSLSNSSYIIVRSFLNSTVSINNVDLIGIISYDNSKIYVIDSIINGYVKSKQKSKVYITQTLIKSPNNIYAYDDSVIYIASLDYIPSPVVRISGENVQVLINVQGSVAVISGKNITIKLYIFELGINTLNPSFVIIGKGIVNKFGEILSYVGENLPNEIYILRLILIATDNTTLQVNKTLKIETPILPTPPPKPLLKYNSTSSYVIFYWEVPRQNPFVPIEGFKIYKGESKDDLKLIAIIKNSSSYIDLKVSQGKKYYYAIRAFNYKGESEMSDLVLVEIPRLKETNYEGLLLNWIASLIILSVIFATLSLLAKSIRNRKFRH